jgi:methionine synthase II (cobalamin-independent)
MSFQPRCLATGIGSLPHINDARALELVTSALPEIPYVPQLPSLSWHEGMLVQYSEGLPGCVLDEEHEKLHLDTIEQGPIELESYYTRVIEDDPELFAVSDDYWRAMARLDRWLSRSEALAAVKAQITGPITQGLSTVDQDRRSVYYDPTFQEVLVKNCIMKARWVLRRLEPYHPVRICFLDEPILSAFGSSVYVSVKREDVVGQIAEVAAAIRSEGGLCGVHCCGNTDWSLLTEAGVDIISFDAFEFGHTLPLYPEDVTNFIGRGGLVAWGVVPTSQLVLEQDVDTISAKLDQALDGVRKLGVPRGVLLQQALITPACGLGSATEEAAHKAFGLLREVSLRFREEAVG